MAESEHIKRAQCVLCDSLHYDYDSFAEQYVLNSEKTAKKMIENGILIPPVCIGQTVYAAIDLDGEKWVEGYKVGGVCYRDGKWYAFEENGKEEFEIGGDLCKITKDDAEALVCANLPEHCKKKISDMAQLYDVMTC